MIVIAARRVTTYIIGDSAAVRSLRSCLRKRDSSGVHGCVVTVREMTPELRQAVFDV